MAIDKKLTSRRDVLLVAYWTDQPLDIVDDEVTIARRAVAESDETATFIKQSAGWWDYDHMRQCWSLRQSPVQV